MRDTPLVRSPFPRQPPWRRAVVLTWLLFVLLLPCVLHGRSVAAPAAQPRSIALLFDSMNSPFWQESIVEMRAEAARRGWQVFEAISNQDDDKQYQQVQSMIQRGVDGIIIIQTDAKAVIPAIRAADRAGVAMVHFNRPPADTDAYSVAVVADNRRIMAQTCTTLFAEARARGGHYQAALLLGDLGDENAVQRRDGFNDAVARNADIIDVVARIPTEWNVDKTFAGLVNALQAHPDINLIVSSSDFLAPPLEQALRLAGKWKPAGDPGRVLIASFDGDPNGYGNLAAGYFDAVGVQNLRYEVKLAFNALEQQWAGQHPPKKVFDPGLVITRANLKERRADVWGYAVATRTASPRTPALAGAPVASAAESIQAFFRAFLSLDTVRDVLLTMLPLAILVTGQLLVLLVGEIDLSVTAVLALCSVLSATVMKAVEPASGAGLATLAGIAVCLATGVAIGLLNGFCTAALRMPSFVVTLAVMTSGAGAAVWFVSATAGSISIGGLPAAFRRIGYGTLAGVPIALFVCVAVLAAAGFLLRRTLAGRWVYAVGHNREAARLSGVPVSAVMLGVFAASGLCAAIASVILTSRLETGTPALGQTMLLDVIGAAVIGGVSLFGGRGRLGFALLGVLFLCVLEKVLQLLGLSLFLVLGIKGLAIVAAASLDVWRHRKAVAA